MSLSADDRRIRSLRPPKVHVDPHAPHGSVLEEERRPDGATERTLTVFFANAECGYTCSFCDLWRWTTEDPTPPGALTAQLERVLDSLDGPLPDRLKLYTAGNFFDRRAVPLADLAGLASLAAPFSAVTVESHARMIGPRTLAFADALPGRLEVAVGLETIHPLAAAQLNKRLDLTRFDAAARWLADHAIALRAFVLLGAPYVPDAESVDWAVRSATHAAACGAAVVSIIPVRGGNGELERLAALGHFVPPRLVQLEDALDRCTALRGTAVNADLWDVERLTSCASCGPRRIERLRRQNLSGVPEQRITCVDCRT